MDKLKRYAHVADKTLSVIKIIFIVLASIAGLALILCMALSGRSDLRQAIASSSVNLGSGVLTLEAPFDPATLTQGTLLGLLVSFLVAMAIMSAIFLLLIDYFRGLLAPMEQGRPFSDESTSKVRRIGVLMLIASVIAPQVTEIPWWFLSKVIQLPSGVQLQVGSFSINGLALIAGLLMLVLSLVFAYGAQLQKQSDETL